MPRTTRPPLSRSEELAAILRDEILAGQYRAGERLPSERDLSERFTVSRGAVREALKKLEQLGIASIQPGGARVVPISDCTLDVLGPLLDLHDLPDPKLVDEVLEMFGVLMTIAARAALEKASDEELAAAQRIAAEMLASDTGDLAEHQALRRLSELFVDVADHLVLKLMLNGLRTTFMVRMQEFGIRPQLDPQSHREIAIQLHEGLQARNSAQISQAMRKLNRLFRDSAHDALIAAHTAQTRVSA